ncbi:hypothetical protein [Azospirillum sp. ST 5-10]|uniref:hypothetical protein n=1 Tax=unclassified Azospirillum TaxID=2630922 RepID=UPI003F4A8063
MDENDWLRLAAIIMVAIIVLPGALPRVRRSPWLRNAAIWLAAVTALVFLYGRLGPF